MKLGSEPTRRRLLLLAAGSGAGAWLGCGDDIGLCPEPTEPNSAGPFFTPDSPERSDLREPQMAGTQLTVRGRVLDADCEPISGALLDFWQADDAGDYDLVGYRLRGRQRSAADGSFELLTIVPGHYLNGASFRPAHLHLTLSAPGAVLTTQLYFEGDPYNDSDALILDSLIMPVRVRDGALECEVDLVLDALV